MSKSENLYSAARELIPGGVNSPVRAFTGVGALHCLSKKRTALICTMLMQSLYRLCRFLGADGAGP